MKIPWFAAAAILAPIHLACGAEPISSPTGAFSIRQEYQGEWRETLSFRDPAKQPVSLAGYAWPGFYSISPDGKWVLRIQKTGSGQNIGILYCIEDSGRVCEVLGFNDALWRVSDARARLPQEVLYHTGITSAEWDLAAGILTVHLRGANARKSGDGIEVIVGYELAAHRFSFASIPR